VRPKPLTRVATHAALVTITFLFVGPVLYAFIKATQDHSTALSSSLAIGGDLFTNIEIVWDRFRLREYMGNTIIVTAVVTLAKTTLSLLAAMAFVYFRFPLQGVAFVVVLFTLMMPTEVLIVALFDVVEWMGLFGTLPALILPFMASATSTFLFRQHFLRIPRDLVEAAQVDGAGPLRFLRSILVPLSWNAIAALAVVDVIYVWNMYLWPRINAVGPDSTMVQVGLVNLLTDQDVNHYGVVMAGAVVSMLPVLIIFLLLQERFTRGFALGAER
jgi:sn-glycerol 3-phosphate transport system permease protein